VFYIGGMERVERHLEDAKQYLVSVKAGLMYPETDGQAAAADFVRVALEAVVAAQKQLARDSQERKG